jgi:hypothetical protein
MSSKGLGKALDRPYPRLIDLPTRLNVVTGIDATAIANHVIYTVPATKSTIIRLVVVRCVSSSGITSAATAGVGVTASEVYSAQQMLGLVSSGKRWIFPSGQGTSPIILAGETLMLRIISPAVGTSQTVEVDVFGHEL